MRRRRAVPLLHLLLLLLVSLLQLLGLLLMLLFSLLLARLIGTLRSPLIFLVLLLLHFLPFLILLGRELVLLLLILLVQVRIARVRRRRTLPRRKVLDMGWRCSHGVALLRPSCRRMIFPSGFSRLHYVMTRKCSRPGGRCNRRSAVICRRPQFRIAAGLLDVFPLSSDGIDVPVMLGNFFLRCGAPRDAALAAVVADVVDHFVIDDGFVVHVVNVDDVNVGHGPVIEEVSAIPAAAHEPYAEISKAIRDSAIEADVRAPISFMEKKCAAIPSPPRRSPEIADLWRFDPRPGHPVVIAAIPGPVAGSPEIAVA